MSMESHTTPTSVTMASIGAKRASGLSGCPEDLDISAKRSRP
jgi:hypothetical protein